VTVDKVAESQYSEVNHLSASSEPSGCSFVLELDEERFEYVANELREFNRSRKSPLWLDPPELSAPLQVYALDESGSVVGGLVGRTKELV
jgi:hypothetical protein